MLFSKTSVAVAIAAISSLASAQSGSMTASAPMASGSVLVHVVTAMNDATTGKPVFSPQQVMANVGDIVQFQFHPNNHSVVQATFADPCIPIQDSASGNGTVGFFSGFMPVAASSTQMPTFSVTVNSTNPIWFYCSQAMHCQNGMVGVINPTALKNLTSFESRAALAPQNVTPGQAVIAPSGSNSTVTMSPPTASGSMTTVVAGGASPTGTSAPSGTAAVGSSTGAAAGMAAYTNSGVVVAIAALAASMLLLA